MVSTPTLNTIERVASSLFGQIVRTPTVAYTGAPMEGLEDSELFIKLEMLQHSGSFKARGALNSISALTNKSNGVTAFSAGNHAIAIAFAAKKLGVSAKVVMPQSANPFRVERCRYWGADVLFGESISDLMSIVDSLVQEDNRTLIHPYDGEQTIEGTATVGLELCQDIPELDVVIVPVGGGGLIAGIASAVKQLQPSCKVIGVEPAGACGMSRSINDGRPLSQVEPVSIADSLSAPMHLPMAFSLVQQHVDELVQVSDDQLRNGMRFMFNEMKLAVEPACAAATAALQGPLRNSLAGKRIALIGCGSNIDLTTYNALLHTD